MVVKYILILTILYGGGGVAIHEVNDLYPDHDACDIVGMDYIARTVVIAPKGMVGISYSCFIKYNIEK
jgi:hypothetical protein